MKLQILLKDQFANGMSSLSHANGPIITIIKLFFTPPILYVILAFVGLGILSTLITIYGPIILPYFYPLFDVIAQIGRFFVSVFSGITWTVRRVSYPIKEQMFKFSDKIDVCCNPWRKKATARVDVPTFQF